MSGVRPFLSLHRCQPSCSPRRGESVRIAQENLACLARGQQRLICDREFALQHTQCISQCISNMTHRWVMFLSAELLRQYFLLGRGKHRAICDAGRHRSRKAVLQAPDVSIHVAYRAVEEEEEEEEEGLYLRIETRKRVQTNEAKSKRQRRRRRRRKVRCACPPPCVCECASSKINSNKLIAN